jgi:geranylgeranyl pyrophosphate synthase
VKALQRLEQAQSRRLEEILTNPELRSQSLALEEGIDLVIASGALEESRQVAQTMIRQAWQAFSPHLPSCDAKLMLHAMSMKLVELAYEP